MQVAHVEGQAIQDFVSYSVYNEGGHELKQV